MALSIRRIVVGQSVKRYVNRDGKKKTRVIYKFAYTKNGKKISSHCVDGMKVPPAGLYAKISDDPEKDKVWAMWTDEKGREQRLYSKSHRQNAHASKYDRLERVAQLIPRIKTALVADSESMYAERREMSTILLIILETGLRIGSNLDTKGEVEAFGVSTLLSKHVKIAPGGVRLEFVGKKGVINRAFVKSSLVASLLRNRKSPAYTTPLFNISGSKCLAYLKEIAGWDRGSGPSHIRQLPQ